MAIQQFRTQEKQLLYATENRMFHIDDLTPEYRKKYGNITDAQYFEYWQGLGAKAYTEGHKWVTSLSNKYRLSLISHNISNPDILSQVMAAQACLELSCAIYRSSIKACMNDYAIPKEIFNHVFQLFDITPVANLWMKALKLTEPKTNDYKLEDIEERNITQGIEQLHEAWSDARMLYGSVLTAANDFSEIFRTKGEQKKTTREIQQILQTAQEYYQNEK
jgi:hypothetical protein